ncbi:hypothetical protein [Serratia plymuthica]|uniref:hypothetical protein n=1 Tax=Serratia plymuthica TaxID=82996 RepID=UPI002015E9FF|nr:hypothetical protein [Serratia plymuthica]
MDTAARRRVSAGRKKSPPEGGNSSFALRFAQGAWSLFPFTPSPCNLRLCLIRVFNGRMALPIPRGHIIILGVQGTGNAADYYPNAIYLFEINSQVAHHAFGAARHDGVMFLRPATTINRLYFNHD